MLARASGLATRAEGLVERWQRSSSRCAAARAAVLPPAALGRGARSDDGIALTSEQAEARLAAIGFGDPAARCTTSRRSPRGSSRRASDPAQPAAGHAAVVRRGRRPRLRAAGVPAAERHLGEAYWFLRMLRDSSGAAHRLTPCCPVRVRPGSFERIPEAAAWLENDDVLRPAPVARCSTRPRRPSRGTATTSRPPPRAAHRAASRGAAPRPGGDPRHARRRRARHGLSDITTAILTGALGPRPPLRRRHRVRHHRDGPVRRAGARVRLRRRRHVRVPGARGAAETRSPGGAGDRARAHPTHRGPALAARPRHRPAARGQERRDRALARVVPRLLRALVADLGGAGAAARPRCRRRRRAAARLRGARRRDPVPRAPSPSTRCARSSASRPGSSRSGCRRAPTRRGTSSSAAGRSATSSGSCSCCSCSTRCGCPGCARPRRSTPSTAAVAAGLVAAEDGERLARRVADRLAARSRPHALDRQDHRRAARRPPAARGRRSAAGVPARVGGRARRGLLRPRGSRGRCSSASSTARCDPHVSGPQPATTCADALTAGPGPRHARAPAASEADGSRG